MGALEVSQFKDNYTLARAQLYESLSKESPDISFYKALALSQLGHVKEAISILEKLQLPNEKKQDIRFRLALIQKIGLHSKTKAYDIAKILLQDRPDFLAILSSESATSFSCPLLQMNQHLTLHENIREIWETYFKDFELWSPPCPIQNGRFSFHQLSTQQSIPNELHDQNQKVSIIVSAYNAAKYLPISLGSLIQQTWKNIEIIVVDDASDDDTSLIATNLLTKIPHKVIRQKVNQGTYVARNTALQHCIGDYIMNHDADDWAHPQKVELQVQEVSDPQVFASVARWFKIGDDSGKIESNYLYPLLRHCTNSILFKREILDKIPGYDEVRIAADERFEMEIKNQFGVKSVKSLKKPLTIGCHSTHSLTGNIFGTKSIQGLQNRIFYRESFIRKLILDRIKK